MHSALRFLTGSLLALLLAFTPVAQALPSDSTVSTLVPPEIASAHTVFVSNGGGSSYFNTFTGGPDRGYSQLYAALQEWGRYQLVDSPAQADLIFEIHSIAPASDVSGTDNTNSVAYDPQILLRILDQKTGAVLWTTRANVHAFGRQASRDQGFDQSVAVLVDRVRQLTGEQLSAAQLKAMQANAGSGRARKIMLWSAVGAGAGMIALGVYLGTHMSTPKLPSAPPCTNLSFCP